MKQRLTIICLGWLVFVACKRLAQAQTNQIFLETMGTTAVNPWTRGFSDNNWLVTGNSFTLASSWNCSADTNANSCGLQFKQGTANLGDSMITTASGIAVTGSSGFVEFWVKNVFMLLVLILLIQN